jgi:hypothetical protein
LRFGHGHDFAAGERDETNGDKEKSYKRHKFL